ncbi:hypothetical protein TSOC_012614 [Tetrabaena socialis]|uniref:Uncharacterized protein n=1 Tax=Tetrabaena socialis TaxID=47790 RepID=A0A2J7ZMK1_9CHLO|nr:hypothetical protein TSOC_012614 [Tetrabaena socialis]|eukprot:PNH01495.1 hypothetical protein TSOC_012614 [Tetrabaena socialis]
MIFPRVFREFLCWVGTTGMFLLPRLGINVVPHLPTIALAFGCNQLTSLTCELDRDYTPKMKEALEAWEALPEEERGECPLGRAEDHAHDAGRYAAKYITKAQPPGDNEHLLQAASHTETYVASLQGQPPPRLLGPEAVKTNLRRAMHVASGRHVVSLTMMAYVLTGNCTFEETFCTAALVFEPFLALALDGTSNAVPTTQRMVNTTDGSGYRLVSDVQDYLLRGDELGGVECSWFMVHMHYERVPLPADANELAAATVVRRPRGRPRNVAPVDNARAADRGHRFYIAKLEFNALIKSQRYVAATASAVSHHQ